MTIAFLRKDCLMSYDGFLGVSFCGSEVAAEAGSAGRGAFPIILKNAAVSLFQKTSNTPMMLAMPEVTVITWSGPAYSARNAKCMKTPKLTTFKNP
jgi:hypothetical protein